MILQNSMEGAITKMQIDETIKSWKLPTFPLWELWECGNNDKRI